MSFNPTEMLNRIRLQNNSKFRSSQTSQQSPNQSTDGQLQTHPGNQRPLAADRNRSPEFVMPDNQMQNQQNNGTIRIQILPEMIQQPEQQQYDFVRTFANMSNQSRSFQNQNSMMNNPADSTQFAGQQQVHQQPQSYSQNQQQQLNQQASFNETNMNNNNNYQRSINQNIDTKLIENLVLKISQLEGQVQNLSSNLNTANSNVKQLSSKKSSLESELKRLEEWQLKQQQAEVVRLSSTVQYESYSAINSLRQLNESPIQTQNKTLSASKFPTNHQLTAFDDRMHSISEDAFEEEDEEFKWRQRQEKSPKIQKFNQQEKQQYKVNPQFEPYNNSARTSGSRPLAAERKTSDSFQRTPDINRSRPNLTAGGGVQTSTSFIQGFNFDEAPKMESIEEILRKKGKSPLRTSKPNSIHGLHQISESKSSVAFSKSPIRISQNNNANQSYVVQTQQFTPHKQVRGSQSLSSSSNKLNTASSQKRDAQRQQQQLNQQVGQLDLSLLKTIIKGNPLLNRPVINIRIDDCFM